MKKSLLLGMGACIILAFASCKSSESAYKKAYEKAKEQELVEPDAKASIPVEVTPVVTPVVVQKTEPGAGVRQEKVTVVSGDDTLKEYSIVCGSFSLKANADGLKDFLEAEGYRTAVVAHNASNNMYRVIVSSFSDRESAAAARDAFKAKYSNRQDFQGSWLLYRLY